MRAPEPRAKSEGTIEANERMIKVDEDENAICRNEENRTFLSLARICMRIRDGSGCQGAIIYKHRETVQWSFEEDTPPRNYAG